MLKIKICYYKSQETIRGFMIMQYIWLILTFFFCLSGCCIYSKPHIFGESSSSESDSDDECPHNAYCTGHKKEKFQGHHHHKPNDDNNPNTAAQSSGPLSTSEK